MMVRGSLLIGFFLTACAMQSSPPAGGESVFIDGPAGTIHVDDGGAGGPPVVFIHSLAGNTTQWRAQLERLRPDRRAIAVDLRGHGRSAAPTDGGYTVAAYGADVSAVADELGLDRFVLVGHSMGAAVALHYAASRPDRVAGLLLVDGGHAREEPTAAEAAWVDSLAGSDYAELIEDYWSGILTGARRDVYDRVMADMRQTRQATVAGSFAELIAHEPLRDARSYAGPTLLVLSEVGDVPAALYRHVDGLDYELVTGTGHWLQMDRPAVFNTILDRFLGEIGAAEVSSGG